MTNKKSPRSYSDEFKKDAVHLLETSGKTKAHDHPQCPADAKALPDLD